MSFAFSSCEKDDICDPNTPTTPRLIIEFYDAANPSILKNVVNLKVTGIGEEDSLKIFNAVSKIELPLKITDDVTQYQFILNSLDLANDNEDNFEINYTRQNVYVSRACGYKTIFTLIPVLPIVYTDAAIPDGSWISSINIETSNIENENETHVKIFF